MILQDHQLRCPVCTRAMEYSFIVRSWACDGCLHKTPLAEVLPLLPRRNGLPLTRAERDAIGVALREAMDEKLAAFGYVRD